MVSACALCVREEREMPEEALEVFADSVREAVHITTC